MRATAEGVQSGTGTGVGDLETPEAGQVDLLCKTQHEANDAFDIAYPVIVMEPEDRTAGTVLLR